MDLALALGALLLGLAGAPHCAAMCGAPCAALNRGDGAATAIFHLARAAGYALAGALVASSVGALALLGHWSPALRPLWVLLHAGALALGVWLLWHGRQPGWLENLGARRLAPQAVAGGWQRLHAPGRAALAGGLWVAWPCGLLQSALVVAALANSALGGAAVMAAFALASSSGLVLGPWLWRRWAGKGAGAGGAASGATRASGALLLAASAWALAHGVWPQWAAYCGL